MGWLKHIRISIVIRVFLFLFFAGTKLTAQQTLTLKAALETAVANYGNIKAKTKYAEASGLLIEQARRDYLPNINFSLQQDIGTVNGQYGPAYGFGGLGVSSAGPALGYNNHDAAFGALYLTNVNWDFFAFGKAKEKIKTAEAVFASNKKDVAQEIFKHKIKVTATYLNLLAAAQLIESYKNNLARADTFKHVVHARALNGLVAGVDSTQANAAYANAQIVLTNAIDYRQSQTSQLSQLLGISLDTIEPDKNFVAHIPAVLQDTFSIQNHPVIQWYKSRIDYGKEQEKYFKTMYYPTFSLVGVWQARGSGFGNNYALNQSDINHSYWDGINPTRTNYLFGIGVTWNITQPYRLSQQVKSQQAYTAGLEAEYNQASIEIKNQLILSEQKIKNALNNYKQVDIQVKAAKEAYLQKTVLYRNGLTTLVDLTQAMYALTSAETDRDIAYNNVWQALLLKAAAAGDFSIFENQL
jgi:outer membrane protein TolC